MLPSLHSWETKIWSLARPKFKTLFKLSEHNLTNWEHAVNDRKMFFQCDSQKNVWFMSHLACTNCLHKGEQAFRSYTALTSACGQLFIFLFFFYVTKHVTKYSPVNILRWMSVFLLFFLTTQIQEQGDVSGTRFLFTSCLLLQLSLTTDWEGRWWKVSFLTPSFLQRHLNFCLCSCSRCCTTERKVKHLMALLMVQNCLFLKVFFF